MTTPKRSPAKLWVTLGAAIAVSGVLLGVAIASSAAPQAEGPSASPSAQGVVDTARRIDGDPAGLGDVNAPVVLVEYADYRCPFCAVFARDTMPDLVEEYVDAGLLRIEWRDFPIFGDDSVRAAVAVRAAGEQGLFWEYHKALYALAPEKGHPPMPVDKLVDVAASIGIPDLAKFEADLTSEEIHAQVQTDLDEAYTLGAAATPVFLINGVPISGAQPIEVFRTVIDERLGVTK